MKTIQEIYDMEPQEVLRDMGVLFGCYYSHMPELENEYMGFRESERAEVRIAKHHDFDFRRYWRLASVWLDGVPVMVIQNAGREGDDFSGRYITNAEKYGELISHVKSLMNSPTSKELEVFDPTDSPADLCCFYGNQLDGYFERY